MNHWWLTLFLQGQALNGELGVGAVNGTYLAAPTPVASNLTFTSLSLGDKFSCGIAGSRAHCWVGHGDGCCSMHLCNPVQACQPVGN